MPQFIEYYNALESSTNGVFEHCSPKLVRKLPHPVVFHIIFFINIATISGKPGKSVWQ
jgi:hypothetical protein